MAAWLAVGEPAAISQRAAAALWELSLEPPECPQVLVPWSRRVKHAGVSVRRTRRWTDLDVVRLGRLRVTSPSRTLFDVSAEAEEVETERALDVAHRRGLVRLERLDGYLEEAVSRRVRGAKRLRALVRLRDPRRPIESELETLLFHILRRGGVPLPKQQHWIRTRSGDRRIDFAYPDHRFAIEVDGYGPRDTRRRFDDDRARDNELGEAGWERRHITWTMLEESALDVVWTVATGLGLEPARWRPRPRRR